MDYEALLNPPQLEAVKCIDGPLLILAGAGSGKTRVLTYRIAYMIERGINPWNILAITFTNKAAGEMRSRVSGIVKDCGDSVWIATFHSTCARILRRFIDRLPGYDTNFAIYDTDDSKSVIKDVAKRLNIDTKRIKERFILNEISSAKNELIDPELYAESAGSDFTYQTVARCYKEYQDTLKKNNALDFDDLLMKCVELFRTDEEVLKGYQDRFRYISVDEYQDTNMAQFEFVRLLAAHRNICVVGDDDQSIYKFRGANIRNILDFEHIYPDARVIKLEQNYRSTSNILNAANAVISNNLGRKSKTLWTDKGEGDGVEFKQLADSWGEAKFISDDISRRIRNGASFKDFAVLYRTNAQSRTIEECMVLEGMPYRIVGGVNFYSRREIKDILAYLKTINNGRDDLAARRIINVPKRGIGQTSITKLQTYADSRGISFYEAVCSTEAQRMLGRSADKLGSFINVIEVLRAKFREKSLTETFNDLLDMIGYEEYLEDMGDEDKDDRIGNIDELRNKLAAYEAGEESPTLNGFLEEVALVADIDSVDESEDRVLLMTLHSAKGLEFKYVYLAGMEDGLFPGGITIAANDREEMEEERRLMYVGITRAMDHLTLTAAARRMVRGEFESFPVSRFVREIPLELLEGSGKVSRANNIIKEEPYKPSTKDVKLKNKPYLLEATKTSTANPLSMGVPDYKAGDRVLHSKYGGGTVLEINPGTKDYQVKVDFDGAGQKIMYAGFAKLKRL